MCFGVVGPVVPGAPGWPGYAPNGSEDEAEEAEDDDEAEEDDETMPNPWGDIGGTHERGVELIKKILKCRKVPVSSILI